MGIMEKAIRSSIHTGQTLTTPYKKSPFTVGSMPNDYLELFFGKQKTPTKLRWEWLEQAYSQFKGKDWVIIGTKFDIHGNSYTFDQFFRKYIIRAVGSYIAVVFEQAKLAQINRQIPNKIKM